MPTRPAGCTATYKQQTQSNRFRASPQPRLALLAGEKSLQLPGPAGRPRSCKTPRSRPVKHQPDGGSVFRPLYLFAHVRKPAWNRHAHRQVKRLLRQLDQAAKACAAPGEHDASRNLRFDSAPAQFVAHQHEQLLRAGLDNLREHARIDRARRTVADACNLDREILFLQFAKGANVLALDFFRLGNWRTQSDGEIVREVVAPDGNRGRLTHDAANVRDHFGGPTANIQETAAKFALVLRERRLGRSELLENGIVDAHARAIHGRDNILSCRARRGHDVDVRLETLADHADGVADVVLRVERKLLRKNVQHFAILRQRYTAGRFDGAANVVALDVARPRAERDPAAAVHAAHVPARHADQRRFHRNADNRFRFLHRAANGAHR